MSGAPLLLEIGCEEIPARMIPPAAAELRRRVEQILDRAGLERGAALAWGGTRRLSVRVDAVAARQEDREQLMLGPPAALAFDSDGRPTRAALGFARKLGVAPEQLEVVDNDKGSYVGVDTRTPGKELGELLAAELPAAVAGMPFPKTMRWAEGEHRWVRPVHWLLALHGERALELTLFGVRSGRCSAGHRFLGSPRVEVPHPDAYVQALEAARVVVDPAARRERLGAALQAAARELGGCAVPDDELLREVVDLVEWPGVVAGRFDPAYLDLPRELLVTTLRHHQKCFSVQDADGELLPAFLAVSNTDRDPSGHVQRGNEWVVGGRLDDARYFWGEDRKVALAERLPRLTGVVFHAACGSYADKSQRVAELAQRLARALDLDDGQAADAVQAARLAKADLLTSLVGEFPELQGVIGGLLLEHEGARSAVARGVAQHYRPAGPADDPPASPCGAVVSVADKLDSIARLVEAGERPSGSRDPLGLRRAANGLLRVVGERGWPLSLEALVALGGGGSELSEFLQERLLGTLRDAGFTPNEIRSAIRPRVAEREFLAWELPDLLSRLEAVRTVRGREDFRRLVQLTERVDNILAKNEAKFVEFATVGDPRSHKETQAAALALAERLDGAEPQFAGRSSARDYAGVLALLAEFIDPVDRFFNDVLLIDPADPAATLWRRDLLARLREQLTRYFDIRELAGQAEGGSA